MPTPSQPDHPARWRIAVAAGVAFPFLMVDAMGETVVWRDTARLFEPVRPLVVAALRHGHLALWNPHEALGVPLFAQQIHAVLHPVSVLLALVAPGAGMDVFAIAYALLAAFGAGFLARRLGASMAGAAVASFGYGLSGYVLGMTSILQYLGAAATAPWVIAGLRVAGEGSPFGLVGAAAAVAVLALAGDPQWAIVAVLIGAALAAEAGGRRGLLRAGVAVGLGALAGAVQLVPGWSYFGESMRVAGLPEAERTMWALAPLRLIELVAPGFFVGRPGAPFAPVHYELTGGSQGGVPFAPSVFIGAVSLVLAAWGVRASRAGRVLGVAALLSLWVALGPALGAEQLLRAVPVWGAFRYSEKLVGPLTLCIAVLAALGVRALASRPRRGALLAGGGALACGAVALLLVAGPAPELFHARGALVASIIQERLAVGLVHAAAGLAVLTLLQLLSSRAPGQLAGWLAVIVAAQSFAAAPFALHDGRREASGAGVLAALGERMPPPRLEVPIPDVPSQSSAASEEFERLSGIESRMGVASYNIACGVDNVVPYVGMYPAPWARMEVALVRSFGPGPAWAAWRRFAVTHVVTGPADAAGREIQASSVAGGAEVVRDQAHGIAVFEVPHRPWAFFAEGAVPASSEDEARARLMDELEAGDAAVVVEGLPPRTLSLGRVLSISRGADSLQIEAEAAGDALLVVNDAFWPGWQATIDGRPSEILRADALVRGVAWPPGRHVLRMRYEPREVGVGIALSAAAWLALAILAAREVVAPRLARRRVASGRGGT